MSLQFLKSLMDAALSRLQRDGLFFVNAKVAKPLSRYAPFRRAGDLVFFAGIIAADPATLKVIGGYSDLPPEARRLAGETGEMSTDMKEGPIAAQSWWILNSLRQTVEAAGGTLNDVVKLTQYFRNLRDFPVYNRIRASFFVEPPASTSFRSRNCCRHRRRCLKSTPPRISR